MFKRLLNRLFVVTGVKRHPTSGTNAQIIHQHLVCCTPLPRLDESGKRRQQSKLSIPVKPTAKVLLLGDSLLANWRTDWNHIHNMAVGGDCVQNTMWMVMNARDAVAAHRFEKIFILVGTNNVTRRMGAAAIISGLKILQQMVNDRWPDAIIFIMTIPHRTDVRAKEPVREKVNAWILGKAGGPSNSFDTDRSLAGNGPVLEDDGLHLRSSAYKHLHRDMRATTGTINEAKVNISDQL